MGRPSPSAPMRRFKASTLRSDAAWRTRQWSTIAARRRRAGESRLSGVALGNCSRVGRQMAYYLVTFRRAPTCSVSFPASRHAVTRVRVEDMDVRLDLARPPLHCQRTCSRPNGPLPYGWLGFDGTELRNRAINADGTFRRSPNLLAIRSNWLACPAATAGVPAPGTQDLSQAVTVGREHLRPRHHGCSSSAPAETGRQGDWRPQRALRPRKSAHWLCDRRARSLIQKDGLRVTAVTPGTYRVRLHRCLRSRLRSWLSDGKILTSRSGRLLTPALITSSTTTSSMSRRILATLHWTRERLEVQ